MRVVPQIQTSCSICNEKKEWCRSLYNYRCPSCLEVGYADKLACRECINNWDKGCPWCRTPLDASIDEIQHATTAGNIVNVVVKQKESCAKKGLVRCKGTWCRNIDRDLCACMYWTQVCIRVVVYTVGIFAIGFGLGSFVCNAPSCCLLVCCLCGACLCTYVVLFFDLIATDHVLFVVLLGLHGLLASVAFVVLFSHSLFHQCFSLFSLAMVAICPVCARCGGYSPLRDGRMSPRT